MWTQKTDLSLINICMARVLESLNDKIDGITINSLLKNVAGKKKGIHEPSFWIPLNFDFF